MNQKGKGLKLDLKLNLSPPPQAKRTRTEYPDPSSSSSSSSLPASPPSSCVSSEANSGEADRRRRELGYSSSPEATSMVLVGCPRCLMYVMLSEDDPKCPKCKSRVLLDFLKLSNSSSSSNKY